MGETLFRNVRIIDGSGEAPFAGEVLVQGISSDRLMTQSECE